MIRRIEGWQVINFDEIGIGNRRMMNKKPRAITRLKGTTEAGMKKLDRSTNISCIVPFVTAAGRSLPSWVIVPH